MIEDLDLGMGVLASIIASALKEEAELVCENLVTCEVSWLECILLLQSGNEVDKSCIPNSVVIASLEVVKAETTELGDGVLCSTVDKTGEGKAGL